MDYRIQPWKHQLQAIEAAKDVRSYGLFFEQGCGKTSTVINILRYKFEVHARTLPTLIFCPPIVIENWRREFLAHSTIDKKEILLLTGSSFNRLCDFEKYVLRYNEAKIVITNYEALYMINLIEKIKKWMPTVVILDESHKCKDITAKRTKKAIEVGEHAMYRYILSGTPIVKNAFDIFPQFLFLDGGETLGKSFRDFRERFFIDLNARRSKIGYFPDWQPRMGALTEINKLIYTKSMRVKKSECLDLPPLVRQTVHFELEESQGIFYQKMMKDAVAEVGGQVVSADLAIKKALRLQQVTTGYVTTDEGEERTWSPNPRVSALEEIIDTIGQDHKIIIWANFRQNYKAIEGLLYRKGISYVQVTGETDPKAKQANIDAFNSSRGGPRVLIGHPASCGIGANLTAASYAIFYSRGFSLENDLQAEARNYRGGSEVHDKITRIDLVAKDTIDEVVLTALAVKQDTAETILKYMGANR